MSGQQQLSDSYVRHNIVMQRYAKGVAREVATESDRLIARLAYYIKTSKGIQQLMYFDMLRDMAEINRAAYERIGQVITQARDDVAGVEIKATEAQLEKYADFPKELVVPDVERVIAIANMTPLTADTSAILSSVLAGLESKTLTLVSQAVKDGVLLGRTALQVAGEVQALTALTSRNAVSLALTAIAEVTNTARRQFHEANSEVLDAEEYTATLDSHTTIFCAGHDGKKYPVGTGPHLPAHYRCRSVYVPVVKEEWIRNIPGGGRAAQGSEGKTTESYQTTYQSFLRRQSKEFQNEVLGKARADLFRSGKLTLDKFTDDSGKLYTLDELKNMYQLTI